MKQLSPKRAIISIWKLGSLSILGFLLSCTAATTDAEPTTTTPPPPPAATQNSLAQDLDLGGAVPITNSANDALAIAYSAGAYTITGLTNNNQGTTVRVPITAPADYDIEYASRTHSNSYTIVLREPPESKPQGVTAMDTFALVSESDSTISFDYTLSAVFTPPPITLPLLTFKISARGTGDITTTNTNVVNALNVISTQYTASLSIAGSHITNPNVGDGDYVQIDYTHSTRTIKFSRVFNRENERGTVTINAPSGFKIVVAGTDQANPYEFEFDTPMGTGSTLDGVEVGRFSFTEIADAQNTYDYTVTAEYYNQVDANRTLSHTSCKMIYPANTNAQGTINPFDITNGTPHYPLSVDTNTTIYTVTFTDPNSRPTGMAGKTDSQIYCRATGSFFHGEFQHSPTASQPYEGVNNVASLPEYSDTMGENPPDPLTFSVFEILYPVNKQEYDLTALTITF